jgi:hypothetical protein
MVATGMLSVGLIVRACLHSRQPQSHQAWCPPGVLPPNSESMSAFRFVLPCSLIATKLGPAGARGGVRRAALAGPQGGFASSSHQPLWGSCFTSLFPSSRSCCTGPPSDLHWDGGDVARLTSDQVGHSPTMGVRPTPPQPPAKRHWSHAPCVVHGFTPEKNPCASQGGHRGMGFVW